MARWAAPVIVRSWVSAAATTSWTTYVSALPCDAVSTQRLSPSGSCRTVGMTRITGWPDWATASPVCAADPPSSQSVLCPGLPWVRTTTGNRRFGSRKYCGGRYTCASKTPKCDRVSGTEIRAAAPCSNSTLLVGCSRSTMGNCGVPVRLPSGRVCVQPRVHGRGPGREQADHRDDRPGAAPSGGVAGDDGEAHAGQTNEGERGDDAEPQDGDVEEQVGHRVAPSPTIGTSTP